MIKKEFFLVFCITIFQKKYKSNTSRDQNDLFINDGKYIKQKALNKFNFHLGWDERIFFLKNIKQQTNILIE